MIKTIKLVGAAPVGDAIRLPSQGPLRVPEDISPEAARALVDVGLAKITASAPQSRKK